MKLSIFTFVALLLGPLAGAQDILLKADHGAFAGGDVWPLGVGVSLKEGQAKDAGQVGIVSRTKGPLAVQCEARTRYPDGSIQWLWADFLGPVEDSYRLVISPQKQTLSGVGVEVVNAGGQWWTIVSFGHHPLSPRCWITLRTPQAVAE